MLEQDMRDIEESLCLSPLWEYCSPEERDELCKEIRSLWEGTYKEHADNPLKQLLGQLYEPWLPHKYEAELL